MSGFPGIAFRAATHDDYELFYLRENLSRQAHATQYTPVLHGLYAWQIYAGAPWEAARWTYDRWMHVKLVVAGSRAELYVDGDTPVQVIPRLRGPEGAGEVGLIAAPGAARFANVVVQPADAPATTEMPPAVRSDSAPATIIRAWRVAKPFPESQTTRVTDLRMRTERVAQDVNARLDVCPPGGTAHQDLDHSPRPGEAKPR